MQLCDNSESAAALLVVVSQQGLQGSSLLLSPSLSLSLSLTHTHNEMKPEYKKSDE